MHHNLYSVNTARHWKRTTKKNIKHILNANHCCFQSVSYIFIYTYMWTSRNGRSVRAGQISRKRIYRVRATWHGPSQLDWKKFVNVLKTSPIRTLRFGPTQHTHKTNASGATHCHEACAKQNWCSSARRTTGTRCIFSALRCESSR